MTASNLAKLHVNSKTKDETIEAFRLRLWEGTKLVVRTCYPECTGQILNVEQSLIEQSLIPR